MEGAPEAEGFRSRGLPSDVGKATRRRTWQHLRALPRRAVPRALSTRNTEEVRAPTPTPRRPGLSGRGWRRTLHHCVGQDTTTGPGRLRQSGQRRMTRGFAAYQAGVQPCGECSSLRPVISLGGHSQDFGARSFGLRLSYRARGRLRGQARRTRPQQALRSLRQAGGALRDNPHARRASLR